MIETYARADPLEPATPFSIRASVIFGWEILRNNFSFLAGVAAITAFLYSLPPLLIPIVDPVLRRVTHDDGLMVQLVNGFTALLDYSIAGLVSMGLIRVSLTFCNDQPAEFGDLFSCYPLFFKFVFVNVEKFLHRVMSQPVVARLTYVMRPALRMLGVIKCMVLI